MEREKNTTRDMMKSNYGEEKLDKSTELNETMTIANTNADDYTKKIHNLGGTN